MLTHAEAADYLGVSPRTLDRMVSAREVECVKLGPHKRSPIRFRREALDECIERRAVAPRVHGGIDRKRVLRVIERLEDELRELRAALMERRP